MYTTASEIAREVHMFLERMLKEGKTLHFRKGIAPKGTITYISVKEHLLDVMDVMPAQATVKKAVERALKKMKRATTNSVEARMAKGVVEDAPKTTPRPVLEVYTITVKIEIPKDMIRNIIKEVKN